MSKPAGYQGSEPVRLPEAPHTPGADVNPVGVEAAGPSPTALIAEAERLRILRETMILRREQ